MGIALLGSAAASRSRRGPLAAGDGFSVALMGDGAVWHWVHDATGRLDDGLAGPTTPDAIRLGEVIAVAAGHAHALALRSDGSVWAWRLDATSAVGDDSRQSTEKAVRVPGLPPAVAIACGATHSIALTADGEVWAWGGNDRGQLGDGTRSPRTTPTRVRDVPRATAIAAGVSHSLAVASNGTVYAWGDNAHAQLGENGPTESLTPLKVEGLADVVAVAAGGRHSVALMSDGTLWAWGDNVSGQTGVSWTTAQLPPTPVEGMEAVVAIAAGDSHSLALVSGGRVFVWGDNSHGQLGEVSGPATAVPFEIEGFRATAIAAGRFHSLALDTEGWIWEWGDDAGSPGGPVLRRVLRASVIPILAAGAKVATPTLTPGTGTYGSAQNVTVSCSTSGATIHYTTNGVDPTEADAVVASGGTVLVDRTLTLKAKAWKPGTSPSGVAQAVYTLKPATPSFTPAGGTYASPQMVTIATATAGAEVRYTADGTDPSATSTLYASPVSVRITTTLKAKAFKTDWTPSDTATATYTLNYGAISAGHEHSVALKPDGTLWAWGGNSYGQIGDGTSGTDRITPVPVSALTAVKAIAAGGYHTLALKTDGTVWGFGQNASGQLGDRSTINRSTAVRAYQLSGVTTIAAGERHSLALKSDQTVYAWGENGEGQLGLGDFADRNKPTRITGLTGVTAIAAGLQHSLALKADGTLWAWGRNSYGVLGNGTSGDTQASPVQVNPVSGMRLVGAGSYHSLALLNDGTGRAWGSNYSGQVGDGTTGTERTVPTPISVMTGMLALAGGGLHTLALTNDGGVSSWGDNGSGQLGDGTTTGHALPAQIAGLVGGVGISPGADHSLALDDRGVVWAWGSNVRGQLGDGGLRNQLRPVPVSDPGFAWKVATPYLSVGSGEYVTSGSGLNVTVTCATAGATIHYTTSGLDPTEADPATGGTVFVTQSATLKAKAWKTGMPPSNLASATYALRVSAPTLSPGPGTYNIPRTVSISTATLGAVIHVTTNGAEPTEADPVSTSWVVDASLTLLAKAWKPGWLPSAPAAGGAYTMMVGTPSLTPGGGSYTAVQTIEVATVTPGATIRYTTSGVEPTTNDPVIASGSTVTIDRSLTFKAKGWKAGWSDSDTAAAAYLLSLGTVAVPTMSPPGGTYGLAQSVTLSSATQAATIRYTTDGREPSWSSPVYSTPLLVESNTTIKAKAYKADSAASATATAAYVIDTGAVATPSFSPATGTYVLQQLVTVVSDTPGAVIHYTTTGVDPTEADPTAASGSQLLVDRSMMLKAKAWKSGMPASGVARADYQVTGAIAAGTDYTLAVKPDGTAWAWGANDYGQLGDGSNVRKTSPVRIVDLTNVIAVAAGTYHSLALTNTGTVWSWGENLAGQLGNNTLTASWSPVQVLEGAGGPLTGVVAIAVPPGGLQSYSLALKGDGTVWGWGRNYYNGTMQDRLTATQIVTLTGVTRIAAVQSYCLALKSDGAASGTVWAWGGAGVGDGTTAIRPNPVSGMAGAIDVAGGVTHSLVLRQDGSVYAWGGNFNVTAGQLGDGTAVARLSPVRTGALTNMKGLAAGQYSSAGVKGDVSLWIWGWYGSYDSVGQSERLLPVPLAGLQGIVAVASRGNHLVALDVDGGVWTWGDNGNGQVGDGTLGGFRNPPFRVPGFGTGSTWLGLDPDGDGLATWRELELGTDPLNADTNGDGIPDGAAVSLGLSPTSTDMDGDGVSNAVEIGRGTDPFLADTDGDTVGDGSDCFPLDSTRSQCPSPTPGDTTPPVIILTEPTGAVLVSSVPPQ